MSILEKAVNKVKYAVESAVSDPNAEKWAAQQEEEKRRAAESAAAAAVEEAQAAAKKDAAAKAAALRARKNYTFTDGLKTATKTFASVFTGLFIVALMIHAGSLCANDAIARSILYRILYFIYGLIPIFSLFILIYYHIVRRFKGTMPRIYTVLPVREQPPHQSSLTALLLAPFTFMPDTEIAVKKSELAAMWEAAIKEVPTKN